MSRSALQRTLLNIVSLSFVFLLAPQAGQAHSDCHFKKQDDGFTGSIVVKGSPVEVFSAIKESRQSKSRKVINRCGNSVLLEEKFAGLPIIGDAKCKYREIEVPPRRIDYKIVQSKQFKRFDGKWELSPMEGGKSTLVKLTSCIDTYIKVPFSRRITDHGNKRDIQRRLEDIKSRVECSSRRQISYVPE